MNNRKVRKNTKWALLLIVGVFTLSSCSGILIKIAYNKSDWFIKNEIDKLFNITWEQDSILADGLSLFLENHRKRELPLIYNFMENILENVEKESITVNDLYHVTNEANALRSRMFESMLNEEFSEFVSTLDMKQVDYFTVEITRFTEPRIRDDGKTFLQRTDKENHARTFERRKKNMITWFGEVTPTQEEAILGFPLYDRAYSELYVSEKKRIGQMVIDQLRNQVLKKSSPHETVDLFQALFSNPRQLYAPKFVTIRNQRIETIFEFLVKLHRTLTLEQKKHLKKEIEYYQDIVTDLMKTT